MGRCRGFFAACAKKKDTPSGGGREKWGKGWQRKIKDDGRKLRRRIRKNSSVHVPRENRTEKISDEGESSLPTKLVQSVLQDDKKERCNQRGGDTLRETGKEERRKYDIHSERGPFANR